MPEFESLLIEKEGAVAHLKFNRPDKLNTFNAIMRREFVDAARQLNLDDTVRVVILSGVGRAFGAGADLSENPEGGLESGEEVVDSLNYEFKPGVLAIANSPKPWIAAINGPCAGISYSYAMACDMVVMAEDAFLYQPFASIGLIPDGGSTWLLSKLVGNRRAFELMIFGEKLDAQKALEWGMINRIFPNTQFMASATALAEDLANRSPLAIRYTKEALKAASTVSLDEAISVEADLQKICITSLDCREAVTAFLEKRDYQWQGR